MRLTHTSNEAGMRHWFPGEGRAFKSLGSDQYPVAPGTLAPFFATGPNVRAGSRAEEHPGQGPFHAKAMGTLFTVCGLRAMTWWKFWDMPFTSEVEDSCPTCRREVWTHNAGGL